jgi:hypothetical protein
MKPGEGTPASSELTFPEAWASSSPLLRTQACVLGIDGQPLDTAPEIDPRSAALIRQADAIAAEYESASP